MEITINHFNIVSIGHSGTKAEITHTECGGSVTRHAVKEGKYFHWRQWGEEVDAQTGEAKPVLLQHEIFKGEED